MKNGFLKTVSVISSFALLFSMTSVVSHAEALDAPLVANGQNPETAVQNHTGDISYDRGSDVAVAAINGGELTQNGNVNFTSTTPGSGAAAQASETVTDAGGGQITINGNVTSNANGVNCWDNSAVTVTGNVSAARTGLYVSSESEAILNGSITSAQTGVDARSDSAVRVNGNIKSTNMGVDTTDSTVTVKGNITSDSLGARVETGHLYVDGNVMGEIGGVAVIDGGSVNVKKNVSGDVSGIVFDMTSATTDYSATVGETISSEHGYAIFIQENAGQSISAADLPTIVVFKIDAPSADNIVGAGTDVSAASTDAATVAAVKSAINYIIKTQGYSNAITNSTATYIDSYSTMKIGDSVDITLPTGYYLAGNKAVNVVKNGDGTYTVTMNSEFGGITLSVLKQAIEEATKEAGEEAGSQSSSEDSSAPAAGGAVVNTGSQSAAVPVEGAQAPSKSVSFNLSEVTSAQMKEAVIENIASTPAGGILRIETDTVSCLDQAMLEAFAESGSIDLELIFTYNGKKIRIFIPRGTDISKLLDENGYCGYLRLAQLLGYQEF